MNVVGKELPEMPRRLVEMEAYAETMAGMFSATSAVLRAELTFSVA